MMPRVNARKLVGHLTGFSKNRKLSVVLREKAVIDPESRKSHQD